MRTSMQQLITIARYLARKTVRAEWKAQGRKVQYINIRELTQASDLYLREHKAELMKQAWKHPAVVRHRQQQRQRLAQRAVISAIGQKGQRVNSIAPSELQKLIAAYVELEISGLCFFASPANFVSIASENSWMLHRSWLRNGSPPFLMSLCHRRRQSAKSDCRSGVEIAVRLRRELRASRSLVWRGTAHAVSNKLS
jgi:hypothetical protein